MKVHLKAKCLKCGEDMFIVPLTTPVDDTFECDGCNCKVKIITGYARWRDVDRTMIDGNCGDNNND